MDTTTHTVLSTVATVFFTILFLTVLSNGLEVYNYVKFIQSEEVFSENVEITPDTGMTFVDVSYKGELAQGSDKSYTYQVDMDNEYGTWDAEITAPIPFDWVVPEDNSTATGANLNGLIFSISETDFDGILLRQNGKEIFRDYYADIPMMNITYPLDTTLGEWQVDTIANAHDAFVQNTSLTMYYIILSILTLVLISLVRATMSTISGIIHNLK